MCDTQAKTGPKPIAEIVREKTNDGELIVDFLIDVIKGKFEDTTLWHRMEATRQLAKLGVEVPQAVLKVTAPSANGRKPSRAPGNSRRNDDLAEIVRRKTSDGEDIVQFLVDVMQGNLDGFKPCHSFSAAKELLRCCYYNTAGNTADDDDEHDAVGLIDGDSPQAPEQLENQTRPNAKRYNDDDDPFDFDHYDHEDYRLDRAGERAMVHIFGSEEAEEVACNTVRKYRTELWDAGLRGDYDYSPIENPGDDPYGKGCYGYKVLRIAFQDNNGIRAANKAVAEYHKQNFKHLINEDGSLTALADKASLEPGTLQYLERSRHLLAEDDDKPLVGADSKPACGPEGPPAPEPPPRNKRLKIYLGPPHEYQDPPSSLTSDQPPNPPAGTGPNPAGDLEHPSTERHSERPPKPPAGAGFKPARDPEEPPATAPLPGKIPAKSSTDPPDDDPPVPEPRRRSGRRRKNRLKRRLLAASRPGPFPVPGPAPAATGSDRGPPLP